jgi:hypothetical protein
MEKDAALEVMAAIKAMDGRENFILEINTGKQSNETTRLEVELSR